MHWQVISAFFSVGDFCGGRGLRPAKWNRVVHNESKGLLNTGLQTMRKLCVRLRRCWSTCCACTHSVANWWSNLEYFWRRIVSTFDIDLLWKIFGPRLVVIEWISAMANHILLSLKSRRRLRKYRKTKKCAPSDLTFLSRFRNWYRMKTCRLCAAPQ